MKYGDLVFSRNAWGSKEVFTTFGFKNLSRPNLGSKATAKELFTFLISQQQWANLSEALEALQTMVESFSPTDSNAVLEGELNAIWSTYSLSMAQETPYEALALQTVIVGIKENFKGIATIGRNKLKDSFYRNALNLFATVG